MADIAHAALVRPLPQLYRWLRANLFATPLSTALTLLVLYVLINVGLPLALILAVGGLALGFPLAVALALGRQSHMPGVRAFSVAYIEFFRGLPFITVLFMAAVLFPLFLPPEVSIAKLWRVEVAFILFLAAYLAEVVRGGLQAIPRGQYEAAAALGLGYLRQTRLGTPPRSPRTS